MSYCRWSSDDFQCDIYCYASCCGGWQIEVATNRRVYLNPLPKPVDPEVDGWGAWIERSQKVGPWPHKLEPIGLPFDGESYNEPTPGEAADRLVELREVGYNVPDYAIEALREEEKETQ